MGSRTEPWRSLVGVAAIALAALAASSRPAAAAEPGVNVASADPASFAMAAQSGARWVRAFMAWSAIEPQPGVIDAAALEPYRQAARTLSASGVHVVWVVLSAPAWASQTGVAGGPPARPAEFARFLHAVAERMRGTVAAYEIWNEPDGDVFWRAPPDAVRYAAVLRAAYPAIKAADPHAAVLFGGLTGNDYAFLEQAYGAGARPYFDAVAVHTDIPCELRAPRRFVRDRSGAISRWSFLGYRTVRATMLAHGDRRPIWMTELGWSASTVPCASGLWAGRKAAGIGESLQAAYLADAYACLAADPYVKVALWFQLADAIPDETLGVRYGLARLDGSRRPAWTAFTRVMTAAGTPPGDCRPHYAGPRVTIGVRRLARGSLVMHGHISAELDVARVTVRLDGRLVYRRLAPPADVVVRLPGRASRGRHTVRVGVLDAAGNAGHATARVGG
jgi:polysaccharide biosynthesis protein PslG